MKIQTITNYIYTNKNTTLHNDIYSSSQEGKLYTHTISAAFEFLHDTTEFTEPTETPHSHRFVDINVQSMLSVTFYWTRRIQTHLTYNNMMKISIEGTDIILYKNILVLTTFMKGNRDFFPWLLL